MMIPYLGKKRIVSFPGFMVKGNFHFQRLNRPYIFPMIELELNKLRQTHPQTDVINMGIGDTTLPLAPSIAKAIRQAVDDMEHKGGVYGYGPAEGYSFLRKAIWQDQFSPYAITPDDIFISDGINTDIINILQMFHLDCSVAIVNPGYPAYVDSNILLGRTSIESLPCIEEHDFIPSLPKKRSDLLYLCSPHNPTGVAMTRKQLQIFIDYALSHHSIILFDHAYQAFATRPDIPKTIYELPGAEQVAIEFCSFSKMAGFTGLRCSYTIIPKTLLARFGDDTIALQSIWKSRQSISFNGVAYPIQKGAAACFTPQGKQEISTQIATYLNSAHRIKQTLLALGHTCYGGEDAPYIWWKTPKELSSWQFFSHLLNTCQIVSIPGLGFGEYGEGYVRLSAFTSEQEVNNALERIRTRL